MSNFIRRPVATPAPVRWYRWAPITCAWMLTAAAAQAAETPPMPMGTMQPSSHPFSQYQRWRGEPLQDWSAANKRVGDIGGWLTYLREAQQDGPDAAPGSAGPHDHHGH